MVEVCERLLVRHLPDRTGRCRTCTQGGTGLPGTHWPCALHGIAELARRRHGHAQGAWAPAAGASPPDAGRRVRRVTGRA